MGPCGHLEREPVAVGLEAEFEQPLGLAFEAGDTAHHVLVEAALYAVGVYVADEAVLVLALRGVADDVVRPFVGVVVYLVLIHAIITH